MGAEFRKYILRQGTIFTAARGGHQDDHFIFLSHYKKEAGTDAALMRHEIDALTNLDSMSPARQFGVPVFLDSEDLADLKELQLCVRRSHNLVVLLTKNVLLRPWVMVEIATAIAAGVRVLPVLLVRDCHEDFVFPDATFYEQLVDGQLVGDQDLDVLRSCDISFEEVAAAIKTMLKRIAVPYSPHRPETIRHAELRGILSQCRLRRFCQPSGGSAE